MRFLALILALLPLDAAARELTDAAGARVKLADHPARIVTLTPALGEIAADLCGEDLSRIVGVSAYSDYPPGLAKVASIATFNKINVETILALKPELVLAEQDTNPADQVKHLRELGLPVVVARTASLAAIREAMSLASAALGAGKAGDALLSRFDEGLRRIDERAKARTTHPKVLLQLDDNPLIVTGNQTFVSEELERIGARNAYPERGQTYPRPATEDAVRRDPDFILVLGNSKSMGYANGLLNAWARFPKMRAVREKQVLALEADAIVRPGPRVLEGMALLERVIYGPPVK